METVSLEHARLIEARAKTEAQFTREVIELAQGFGWLVAHFRPGMTSRVNSQGKQVWVTPMQGNPGFPDLVLVKSPRLIFAELKREGAKPTEPQRAWLEALEAGGCRDWEVYVWRPRDMETIREILFGERG